MRIFLTVALLALGVSFTAMYSSTSSAAGIFDGVPSNLIPIYAKYNIMPSKQVSISLSNDKYSYDQVPVSVDTDIQGIKSIVLLVVENQHPLVAVFTINHQSFESLQTNIRLDKSSDVVALIDTGEQIYGNSVHVGLK